MAWIGPVVGAAGSVLGGAMGQSNVAATNATNMAINKQTMDWETMMSNTAMARRVADLRSSGLNPMLAISQGGASTPGFSPIAMQSSNAMGQGIANASQAANQYVQNANLQADTQKKQADAAYTQSQTPSLSADSGSPQDMARVQQAAVAQKAVNDAGVAKATLANIQKQTENLGSAGELIRAQIQNAIASNPGVSASSQLSELDLALRQSIQKTMVETAIQQQRAAGSSAQALDSFNRSIWGQIFNSAVGKLGPTSVGAAMHSAASAVSPQEEK